jgi:hypothetical protein
MTLEKARFIRLAIAPMTALALIACSPPEGRSSSGPDVEVASAPYGAQEERLRNADEAASQPQEQAGGMMLAYSYSMGIAAPKDKIPPMLEAHQRACIDAGPSLCQVLGSSINSWSEDYASANLNLRAEPEWLKTFRESITADAENAGGRITSNSVQTEDLTQYIIDVDARLEAKKALRDRIKIILEEREGTLSDMLAAERALAEVQGEIDSMTASLEAAKKRVAMSMLSISYSSDPETSYGLFKPLREAFGDFARTSVESLAAAVNFVARAWPFFIVGLIALAILRFWWRGRRRA